MVCKNCNNSFTGNFCNVCGQKAHIQRINRSYIVNEISNIFQVNRGLFYTIKELAIRPGHAIREFLEGKRSLHFKPLAFLLITSAFYVLIKQLTDENAALEGLFSGMSEGMKEGAKVKNSPITQWLSKNFTYANLLLLPLFSLASFIAISKSKYNYYEHLIINLYIAGQQMLIYSCLSFTYLFTKGSYFELIPIIASILYLFWVFTQLFELKKLKSKILQLLAVYILYMILMIPTSMLVFIFDLIAGLML